MRLWHYKLIKYLPTMQLRGQWSELNSIFKRKNSHILINYVYEYPKDHLFDYACMVMEEMKNRGLNVKAWDGFSVYFKEELEKNSYNPYHDVFPKHHNSRYLLQCFYNLQEKFDRGQKDFTKEQYQKLHAFVLSELNKGKFGRDRMVWLDAAIGAGK